jgi:hypothetical protein
VGDAGEVEVDAVALERDALGPEALALLLPHRQGSVGADDAPPRQIVGQLVGGEEAGREARGAGRDIAVGPDESLRDLPDGLDDGLVAVGGDA